MRPTRRREWRRTATRESAALTAALRKLEQAEQARKVPSLQPPTRRSPTQRQIKARLRAEELQQRLPRRAADTTGTIRCSESRREIKARRAGERQGRRQDGRNQKGRSGQSRR